jgi:RnfABCDGE-type electron transport complex B subunit
MSGIILVAVIAIIAGLLLSVASVVFAVPVDEKQIKIREVLPGANCGACGFSGCDGYAAALAAGTAQVGACSPGGADVAQECAEILGQTAGAMVRKCRYKACLRWC